MTTVKLFTGEEAAADPTREYRDGDPRDLRCHYARQ